MITSYDHEYKIALISCYRRKIWHPGLVPEAAVFIANNSWHKFQTISITPTSHKERIFIHGSCESPYYYYSACDPRKQSGLFASQRKPGSFLVTLQIIFVTVTFKYYQLGTYAFSSQAFCVCTAPGSERLPIQVFKKLA